MSRRRRDRGRTDAPTPAQVGRPKGGGEVDRLPLTRWTVGFGATGLASVLLGFGLLHQGSISLAPVLLVVGFLVLLPLALVK
jgi:hypothetical protein